MTSIYYIKTYDGEVFELDATLNVSISSTGSLSSYRVEGGNGKKSDNYVNNNTNIQCSGLISDIKNSAAVPTSKDTNSYISGLLSLKESKTMFSFTWREDTGSGGATYVIDNCLFTDLSITQDASVGYAKGVGKHCYRVSFGLKQTRLGSRAVVETEVGDIFVNLTADKKSGKGGLASFDDEDSREALADSLGYAKDYYLKKYGG